MFLLRRSGYFLELYKCRVDKIGTCSVSVWLSGTCNAILPGCFRVGDSAPGARSVFDWLASSESAAVTLLFKGFCVLLAVPIAAWQSTALSVRTSVVKW